MPHGFMRHLFLYICLAVLCLSTPAYCQDFIVARVVSVSHDQLELIVVPAAHESSETRVQIAEDNSLPQYEGKPVFPDCVAEGTDIRLWGEAVEKNRFLAKDIKGCRHGGCLDPTGVRSRLKRVEKRDLFFPSSDEGFHSGGRGSGGKGNNGGSGNGSGNGGGGGGGGNR